MSFSLHEDTLSEYDIPMRSGGNIPRLVDSASARFVDLRRPFCEVSYVQEQYVAQGGSAYSVNGVFSQCMSLGCRTLVIEDIPTTEDIQKDDSLLAAAIGGRCFSKLQRLTFWTSAFSSDAQLATQPEHALVGYVILREENRWEKMLGDVCSWYVYESVLSPPSEPDLYVPRQNTFAVRTGPAVNSVSGVLFCGQNGRTTTCAHTSLRSLATHVLGRDVSYQELQYVLPEPDLEDVRVGRGLTPADIVGALEAMGLETSVFVYGHEDIAPSIGIYETLANTISSTSGSILCFETEVGGGHTIFVYGYSISRSSVEPFMQSAYFGKPYKGGPTTLTSWVNSYLCNDDNFGSYVRLPRHFGLGHGRTFVISALPENMSVGGTDAIMIASFCLAELALLIPEDMIGERNEWLQHIKKCVTGHTAVLRPIGMRGYEYLRYLAAVQDWDGKRENPALLNACKFLGNLPWLWVVEISSPALVPGYFKLGEVVLEANERVAEHKLDLSRLVFARLPGTYALPGSEPAQVTWIPNRLTSRTPFIGRGEIARRDREYDVALSFAGEDRDTAEELASILCNRRLTVFYDEYERAALWGKDLYQRLNTLYRDMAQYCIVFVSQHYAAKLWPRHELKAIQARAFAESDEYLLPVRIDDTEVPGLNETVGYVDLRKVSIEELADLILQKLGR